MIFLAGVLCVGCDQPPFGCSIYVIDGTEAAPTCAMTTQNGPTAGSSQIGAVPLPVKNVPCPPGIGKDGSLAPPLQLQGSPVVVYNALRHDFTPCPYRF
jgi:hypothetical protein